jgi:hypothetical protein
MPLVEAIGLLIDDRDGYIPPVSLLENEEGGGGGGGGGDMATAATAEEGTLLARGTVDTYITTVIKL